jgi:peptide/nickel transport system permease protein
VRLLKFVVGRLLLAVPTLVLASILAFAIIRIVPGNPAALILGLYASPEQLAEMNHRLGADQPLFIHMYHWFAGLLHGDLGKSLFTNQAVTKALAQAAPVTVSLAVGGTIFAACAGIGLGVAAALRGGWLDRVIVATTAGGAATPAFWLALLLVLVFAIWLPLLPATGYTPISESPAGWVKGLILGVIAIGVASVASLARQTRSAMLEELGRDYVRTLRAAGVSRRSIIFKHALRNAGVTVSPAIGIQFIGILSSAVVIEQVFAMPGVGALTVGAVLRHDYPLVQGAVLFGTVLVILAVLVFDVVSYLLNPRLAR